MTPDGTPSHELT